MIHLSYRKYHNTNMKLLRLTAVIERVGIQKSKIYELIHDGKFPGQIKICGASAWIDSEIELWIQNQIKGSRP